MTRVPAPANEACRDSGVEIDTHFTIALGIFLPVFPHLDEQEEVHLALQHLLNVLLCGRAHGFDSGATFAQHNRLLAVAGDEDDMADLDAAILEIFPALGFDGEIIRELVMQLPE